MAILQIEQLIEITISFKTYDNTKQLNNDIFRTFLTEEKSHMGFEVVEFVKRGERIRGPHIPEQDSRDFS